MFRIRQLSSLPGGLGKKHRRGEMEAAHPHGLDVPVARFMETFSKDAYFGSSKKT